MSEHNESEIDRLLQDAFDSRQRGGGSSPSMIDVRHRARRHQRRRVGGVVGATAMLGVSGVAVLASRGSSETGLAGDEATTSWAMTGAGEMCGYTEVVPTTYEVMDTAIHTTITWIDTTTLAEATVTTVNNVETLAEAAGCIPSGQFRCVGNNGMDDQGYTYFEYCEGVGPSPYTTTTVAPLAVRSIVVVDSSGGLAGAVDDMVARFSNSGFGEVTILEGTRTFEQTMLMPTGDSSGLDIVRQLSGIDGFDTWTADLIAGQLPVGTLVVIVIGQDYWTREQLDPNTPPPTTTEVLEGSTTVFNTLPPTTSP